MAKTLKLSQMQHILFDFLARHIELTDDERKVFSEMDLFKSYSKGTLLLKEGEYARQSYFVIKGCLRSYYLIDGEEKTTAFFLEEDGISPESIVENAPSKYFISCEEDCVLLAASPEMEKTVFKEFPKFESLCRVLTEKELARKQASYADFFNSSAEERYLTIMKTRPQLLQRVPQYQIASYIGIKPESLSRIRKRQNIK